MLIQIIPQYLAVVSYTVVTIAGLMQIRRIFNQRYVALVVSSTLRLLCTVNPPRLVYPNPQIQLL